MRDSTTMGFDPRTVASLLGIAFDPDVNADGVGSAEAVTELLDACLAAPVGMATMANVRLAPDAGEAPGHSSASLGEILTGSEARLETLCLIREHAKQEASRESSEVKQATATTIYFATIANALVFHDRKLTTHSDESLERSFDELVQKPWMSKALGELFSKAREICRKRG